MVNVGNWDHRVMRKHYPLFIPEDEWEFGIYEVYYNNKGKVVSWTQETIPAWGADLEELIVVVNQIRKSAFGQPVLDYETGREI